MEMQLRLIRLLIFLVMQDLMIAKVECVACQRGKVLRF